MCGTLAKHNTQKENVVKTLIERIKKTTKRLNTLTILNRHISFFPFGFLLHFGVTTPLMLENKSLDNIVRDHYTCIALSCKKV